MVEALAAADIAADLHVRQEAHLDGLDTLAFTTRAAARPGVEGKARCVIAAHARFGGVGKESANRIPEADIGGRAGARCFSDRRLIDFEHPVDGFAAFDGLAAHRIGQHLKGLFRASPTAVARCDDGLQIGQQHIARKAGLARSGYPGDHGQSRQRNPGVEALQVVQSGIANHDRWRIGHHRSSRRKRMGQRVRQEASGQAVRMAGQRGVVAGGHDPPAQASGARTDVDHMIGPSDGVFIVLDHQQGVAPVAQRSEGVQQHLVVARMQADGGLVQHIAHALQVRSELRGQPDALGFTARKRGRCAGQRQVAQADIREELKA